MKVDLCKSTPDGSFEQVVDYNHVTLPSPTYLEAPIEQLFALPGMMEDKEVTVLKDDGCNTNILSTDFVRRNRHLLQITKRKTIIKYSDKNTTLLSNLVVINDIINIDKHIYNSNWVVADSR